MGVRKKGIVVGKNNFVNFVLQKVVVKMNDFMKKKTKKICLYG